MKIKKSLLLIIIILFITGCKAECDLIINRDLTVKEKIIITEKNKVIYSYAPRLDNYINRQREEMATYYKLANYKINSFYKVDTAGVAGECIYNDVNDLVANSLLNNFYEGMTIVENDDIITMEFSAISGGSPFLVNKGNEIGEPLFTEIIISLTLPFKVISHNAIVVDVSKNKYSWYYNSSNPSDNLMISFSQTEKQITNLQGRINNFVEKHTYVPLLVVAFLIILVISIVIIIIRKGNKNNQL